MFSWAYGCELEALVEQPYRADTKRSEAERYVRVTLLAFFAACQIMGVAVTWYMVVAAIILGVFVAYAAMFGFDKLKQSNSIKQNK